MSTRIRSALTDPDIMFSRDLMENPGLVPQLSDPDRIPCIEAFCKVRLPGSHAGHQHPAHRPLGWVTTGS